MGFTINAAWLNEGNTADTMLAAPGVFADLVGSCVSAFECALRCPVLRQHIGVPGCFQGWDEPSTEADEVDESASVREEDWVDERGWRVSDDASKRGV